MSLNKLLLAMLGLLLTQGCATSPASVTARPADGPALSRAPANDELILRRATRLRLPY